MIAGQPVLRLLLFFFLFLAALKADAQPTLPDIAGSADKGVVILSWVCQYEGIKSIAVVRSLDSTKITKNIGYVKQLGKGLHAFADAHPEPGKNFYKLTILFKSGLSWSSNQTSVYVDKAMLEEAKTVLPANDSIQHFVVSETMVDKAKEVKEGVLHEADTTRHHKIVVSFDIDSNAVSILSADEIRNMVTPPRKRITVTFDDPTASETAVVQYRFIKVDALTGHVDMNLPEDVGTHHYSVKFYDEKGTVVMEVSKISRPNIIFDKRNFQKKGIYKFVIRRDVVELESGYVSLRR